MALLEGDDYRNRHALLEAFDRQVEQNKAEGRVVISSGMDVFHPETDEHYDAVFKRADREMYEHKKALKAL